MKSSTIRSFTVLCASALCFLAKAEEPEVHEVLTWKSGGNWLDGVWTNSKGEDVSWVNGSIARKDDPNIGADKACEVTAYAIYWDCGGA